MSKGKKKRKKERNLLKVTSCLSTKEFWNSFVVSETEYTDVLAMIDDTRVNNLNNDSFSIYSQISNFFKLGFTE